MNQPLSLAPAVARPSLWRRVPIAWVQLAIVVIVLGALPLAKYVDPDFWWHLRTGRLIVESGIPRHDPFSWTAAGKAWVTHEWLSEVVIYGLESTLGYIGNVLFFGVVASGALLFAYALGRRLGAGTKPLVLLLIPRGADHLEVRRRPAAGVHLAAVRPLRLPAPASGRRRRRPPVGPAAAHGPVGKPAPGFSLRTDGRRRLGAGACRPLAANALR